MATQSKTFNSEYGFGVNEVVIIDDARNLDNVSSVTLKNDHFTGSQNHQFITSGVNNTILTLDGLTVPTLSDNTINFVTTRVIGTNATGSGHYSVKFETTVKVDSGGNVSNLGELKTTIKDSIPSGQNWSVFSYDSGGLREFSYSTSRGGTTDAITWIAYTEIVSIDWTT